MHPPSKANPPVPSPRPAHAGSLRGDGFREQYHLRSRELERARAEVDAMSRELRAMKTKDQATIMQNMKDQLDECKEVFQESKNQCVSVPACI